MRVLVLGGTGFLGAWAVRSLISSGADVGLVARPTSSLWRLGAIRDVDIQRADEAQLAATITGWRPDAVLSLDWAGVAGSDRDNLAQFRNLDRLRVTVRAAIDAGAARFVGVGSQAEYGPQTGVVSETQPCSPVTAYGRAKLEAGRLVLEETAAAGIEGAWTRVFSTFGPLDHSHWVLPQLAASVLAGVPAPLTDGRQRWSFLPGPDAGDALAKLALAPSASGIFNLGHPEAPPLRTTLESFAHHLGRPDLLDFGAIPHHRNSVMWLQPDVSRITDLGWRPTVGLEAGLEMTAKWLLGRDVADPILPGLQLPRAPDLP